MQWSIEELRGGKFKIKHVEKQCPVELGDELEVNITDICPNGDGMSKIQGYVIKVPKAKPRDRVKVKINTSRRKGGNWRNNQIIY